ncbi:MAG TPA: MOSC N-terminal beta barrel domain-containing protein [Thermoanaerobaculia bacterium]|nr:MOSC N-terminal beta barrel domain-containing protein [Thermoanaerobaculia bacterium]
MLRGLFVYPVKSLRGIALDSARATAMGLELDRQWMLVGASGRCVTQIEQPRMSRVDVAIEHDSLRVEAPGMPPLRIPLRHQNTRERDVKLFRRPRRALPVSLDADQWFTTFLDTPCTFVQTLHDETVSFANQRPFHVVTEASWRDLNGRLPSAIPIGRFRPNFIIDGAAAYEEDRWTTLRIGNVPFRALELTERCAVTTVDSARGIRDGIEPLRALSEYRAAMTITGRRVRFGRYLALADGNTRDIRIGDDVIVTG